MIDWSKPLRTIPNGFPATAHLVNGSRVVRWTWPSRPCGPASIGYVDESGCLELGIVFSDGDVRPIGYQIVENATVTKWAVNGSRGSESISGFPQVFDTPERARALASALLYAPGVTTVSVTTVEVPA